MIRRAALSTLLVLSAIASLPSAALAQRVVVNPPGPGRVVVRAPGHGHHPVVVNPPGPGVVVVAPGPGTTVVNPPGPGRVVVHNRTGRRNDPVVVNPPGQGRVVTRRGHR